MYLNINIVKTFSASYNPLIIRILLKQLPVGFKQDALHKGANGIAINNDINYSNCLTKLPKYNKAEYQTAMIQRSKMINSLYQNKTLRNCITKSFYDCLYKIISEMPFMEKIIASCMG